MLIEFTVENFRSIKEPVTFSMLATKDKKLDENLIKNALKGDSLLKTAAIYGANASGKTNVLLALQSFSSLVLMSHHYQKGRKIGFTPFKLDKKCLFKPTKMSVAFIKDRLQYKYSVSFTGEKFFNESLHYYPNNRKAIIFERKNTDEYKFTVHEKKQKLISERTLPNQLYLSKATQDNYEKTSPAFDWFTANLQMIQSNHYPSIESLTSTLLRQNDESKKYILKALLEADLGIDGVSVRSKPIPFKEISDVRPEFAKFVFTNKEKFEINEVKAFHKGVAFNFENEESEGTKRIFSLIGFWVDSLKKGRVLLVDELDVKLHPLLTVFLIELFHDPTQNKKNAQLIFTTHNTNFLDQDLFRRDQIWFTEKDHETGSTHLYSLVEYKARNDENVEKRYLLGKYGALPFIKETDIF